MDQLETQKLIPKQYHQHWRVFSEEAAQLFPPSRLDNHTIELKPGAPLNSTVKFTVKQKQNSKPSKNILTRIWPKDTSLKPTPPTPHPCSSMLKVMGNYAPL
jgi:hypothetical protein